MSKEIYFTKGPWKIGGPIDSENYATIETSTTQIANILTWDAEGWPNEAEANAHLIASAPELFEALRNIIDIGKRDMSNPKYDGYFIDANRALHRAIFNMPPSKK